MSALNNDFVVWVSPKGHSRTLTINDTPCIYIQESGEIVLSKPAWDVMERPKYLLVMRAPGKIGFRKCDSSTPGRYAVEVAKNYARVSCVSLTKALKLIPPKGQPLALYTATVDDRTLIVNTKQRPIASDWIPADEI